MNILFFTTSFNSVRQTLEKMPNIKLHIIDCADYQNESFYDMKKKVREDVNNHFKKEGLPDLMLSYRYPLIIPKDVFSKTRLGAYNIHPSLLPKYSGLNPWEDIFRNHESESGVTLHQITENVDAGPVVFQSSFMIEESDTLESARKKADIQAAELTRMLIEKFI